MQSIHSTCKWHVCRQELFTFKCTIVTPVFLVNTSSLPKNLPNPVINCTVSLQGEQRLQGEGLNQPFLFLKAPKLP